MNVLAIGCHPDDMEISCSGTLAKCVKRGDKVTVCHVANGNMGHEIISPEELRVIRINEAKKAGTLAGIEVVTLDIGDLLPNGCDTKQRDMVVDLIKKVQPDFIITHRPTDYMPDHREVSKL
ncbi:MAG: PIG-L family deacetylase, partial [Clostridia bacterium]|nr:PIG-L family deacetylase [Clostridia bacterium]